MPRVLRHVLVGGVAAALVCLAGGTPASAQRMMGPAPGKAALEPLPMLKDVRVDPKLGTQVPLDIPFVDETGRDVSIGDYFGKRPVVLALVYYECPMLCTQVLSGLFASMKAMPFSAGQEFEVVAVSFDPGETPALGAAKKQTYIERYGRPGTEAGLHFLTGREESIRRLTDAVGFRYAYDTDIDQYAHPALATILTSGGVVSKYLFGIEFMPRDLRLAIVDSGEGRVGTIADHALLYCFQYDEKDGRYSLIVMNVVRAGGVLMLLALGGFILVALRRERRQRNAVGTTATGVR